MDSGQRQFILDILDASPDLTIATNRADGWPQATTVSFAHDGLTLYFGLSQNSQKAGNMRRDPRVSLTVDAPYGSLEEIRGVSMAAEARFVTDPGEMERIGDLMRKRFGTAVEDLGVITPETFALVELSPKVISILDYSKGFGHTELVEVSAADLA